MGAVGASSQTNTKVRRWHCWKGGMTENNDNRNRHVEGGISIGLVIGVVIGMFMDNIVMA